MNIPARESGNTGHTRHRTKTKGKKQYRKLTGSTDPTN